MARGRGPVVHLDRSSKAKQIEAIVRHGMGAPVEDLDLLDIGCGNGEISRHFAKRNRVSSVDVVDQRNEVDPAIAFALVADEVLPYADSSFDLVLSHHVIEHVDDQQRHLAEIRRVLRPGGWGYLATPNRSSPIMEGHVGNDQVLRWPEMVPMLEGAGYDVTPYGWRLVRHPDEFHGEVRQGRFLPTPVVKALARWYPSHVFMMHRT